ncbi:hypothetical protein G5B30_04500 [Sphingobacterium sp. SGG-5]|uniref:hypothetical protein n=1 Tax=Sphingobacterium sp. SGG-5 TaxID=2710881 RepID=UPI0013EB191B|nr:hypothetical protein [Sphingobacterium sp. SGG-5]NGM61176.1 hypothetical protein [Sphingobacterium sp. SGG-5]
MIDTQAEIDKFLDDLRTAIPYPVDMDRSATIPTAQINTLFIYIYPPHTVRQPNVAGFQTIHLDVDLLSSAHDKVIDRIRGLLGAGTRLYARDTVVARVDKKVAMAFQEEYHMQVALPGKYRYGLYHRGELVSVAVFSGGRRMDTEGEDYRSFELLRFCHKGGYIVVGGISKLLNRFIHDFHPDDIMTYADLDWCQQSSLERIGFQPIAVKEPQTFYIEDGHRHYKKESKNGGYTVQNSGSLKLKRIL